MSLSRRAFVKALGTGSAGVVSGTLIAGRVPGMPAGLWPGGTEGVPVAANARPLLLNNNENPLGPGEVALSAIRAVLVDGPTAGRYTGNVPALTKAIAEKYGLSPDHVLMGCGSSELLRSAVQVFTSKSRPLVEGFPTYEACRKYAELIGTPVQAVPLDSTFRLDLEAMGGAARGAGLVYLCNPNNPTATVHSADAVADFIASVSKSSPDTTILVDEAYHDYVTDSSHKTQIPLAAQNPRVVVTRTFSKAHGMAGLRVGYAIGHPKTIKTMSEWESGARSVNVLGVAAAIASIKDQAHIERERARNTEALAFARDWFEKAGYKVVDSQTNFLFMNIRRPAKEFREACEKRGVLVARDFSPFEKTHVRISVGTLEEMRQATKIFREVLGIASTVSG